MTVGLGQTGHEATLPGSCNAPTTPSLAVATDHLRRERRADPSFEQLRHRHRDLNSVKPFSVSGCGQEIERCRWMAILENTARSPPFGAKPEVRAPG
jgi:hypothetical protein